VADVTDFNASHCQHYSYQEMAMTVGRVLFAAEHGDPKAGNSGQQPLEAHGEEICLCQPIVANVAIRIVERLALWAPSELLSKRHIVDPVRSQALLKRQRVKVRNIS
jgi:hypothetical protein